MGRNSYPDSTAAATVALAVHIKSVVGSTPATWGLTADQMSYLDSAADLLQAGNAKVVSTRADARSAVNHRAYLDKSCKAAIADIARSVYNGGVLSPAQIEQLGFQPRKTDRTRVVPTMPTGLLATVRSDGTVALTFKRGDNAYGVGFKVESQASPTGPWAYVTQSTSSRIRLDGFAPGEYAAFRIVATKNGIDAPPSNVATIYPVAASSPEADETAGVHPRFLKKAG